MLNVLLFFTYACLEKKVKKPHDPQTRLNIIFCSLTYTQDVVEFEHHVVPVDLALSHQRRLKASQAKTSAESNSKEKLVHGDAVRVPSSVYLW